VPRARSRCPLPLHEHPRPRSPGRPLCLTSGASDRYSNSPGPRISCTVVSMAVTTAKIHGTRSESLTFSQRFSSSSSRSPLIPRVGQGSPSRTRTRTKDEGRERLLSGCAGLDCYPEACCFSDNISGGEGRLRQCSSVSSSRHSLFGFPSDFGIRISDLVAAPPRHIPICKNLSFGRRLLRGEFATRVRDP
jgi:hypothetical protein